MTVDWEALIGEDADPQRKAVEQIRPLYEARKARDFYAKDVAKLDPSTDRGGAGPLRAWLYDHDGEELTDGESGLVAWMQAGAMGWAYDSPIEIRAKDDALFDKLFALGALLVDGKRVEDLIKNGVLMAVDIDRWRHKVGKSAPALKIEKAEEHRGR